MLARGESAPPQRRVVVALGALGVVLGLLTILTVLIEVQRDPPAKEREGRARTTHG